MAPYWRCAQRKRHSTIDDRGLLPTRDVGCDSRPVLYDQAKIYVEGGRGGDGCVSFRREAHVPRGGPDGGDGGRGGDVVLVCDPSRRDLASLHRARHLRAGRGGHGRGKQQHGARGKDKVILVAPGTEVGGLEGRHASALAGQRGVARVITNQRFRPRRVDGARRPRARRRLDRGARSRRDSGV